MFKKSGVIYKIVNLTNNKVYVGKTKASLKKRWSSHVSASFSLKRTYLHRAICKYGPHNFSIEEICSVFRPEFMDLWERYFIKLYKSTDKNFGYNLTTGGDGQYTQSKESIAKRVKKLKGQKRSAAFKAKQRQRMIGFKHSPETKQKMSESKKGKVSPRKGIKLSRKQIESLRKANLGRIPWNRKPIIALRHGIIIKEYPSITHAEKDGFYQQNIQMCLKGKFKQYKGYQWKYFNKEISNV